MARVVLNHRELEGFLKGSAVRGLIARKAAQVVERAGSEDFEYDVRVGSDRVRAYVVPKTRRGRRRQKEEHILEKAVGGIR